MIKNLTGGAIIPYGTTFPTAAEAYDGALFFKSAGTDKGLYLFGFNQDSDNVLAGEQVSQNWNVVVSNQLFVSKSGDTMSGPLTFSSINTGATYGTGEEGISFFNAVNTINGRYGALRWIQGGTNLVSAQIDVVQGASNNKGSIVFGTRGTSGGVTERMRIDENGISANGATLWTAANDGSGSGLDADLLDGLDSTYFLNASNLGTGTINLARLPFTPIQQGGGINQNPNKIYIGWSNTSRLNLQVDSTNFADTWPININGAATSASTANYATTAGSANTVAWSGVTGFPTTQYVNRSGDTMSGSLTVGDGNGDVIAVNGIRLDWGSNSVYAPNTIYSANAVYAGLYGTSGVAQLNSGGGGASGYLSFNGPNGTRTGYIGNAPGNQSQDNGIINYVGQYHNFFGSIVTNGNVTAYASDARLKKNVKLIDSAVEKVISIGGYSYDWDEEKCRRLGFTPTNMHEHGLIAQEVQKVMPDAVAPAPFNNDYLTVRYERIVALLTAAVGEQAAQIASLQARLALIEGK